MTSVNRIAIRRALSAACILAAFAGAARTAPALDYQGRVDTSYQMQMGDNALDNDLFQLQFLDLSLLEGLSFQWSGGVRLDLDGTVNEVTGGLEKTDIGLRGLPDAISGNQALEYRIYSAYLAYNQDRFGALVGRYNPVDYEFSQFDGLLLWASPLEWLRVEAFGGKPWHYGSLYDLGSYWGAGELVVGAGADAGLLEDRLQLALRYLFLREQGQQEALVGETAGTFLSNDHLLKARVRYAPADWLDSGASAAFLNLQPRSVQAWVAGSVEPLLIRYSLAGSMQLIDIADISSRLSGFSAFLTSSHPYFSLSAGLSKNFADLFNLGGFLDDIELELSYEHRQPLQESDQSMFNPRYDQFRVGALASTPSRWSLQLFYNFILTNGVENTIHAVGGEIARKWEKFEFRLGSSYFANWFETDYTQTVFEDSYFAQEYYLRLKYAFSRALDLTVKGSFEHVRLASLTSVERINGGVEAAPMTELFSEPRNYGRVDVRLGYRF